MAESRLRPLVPADGSFLRDIFHLTAINHAAAPRRMMNY